MDIKQRIIIMRDVLEYCALEALKEPSNLEHARNRDIAALELELLRVAEGHGGSLKLSALSQIDRTARGITL